jgi:hypothetical protein
MFATKSLSTALLIVALSAIAAHAIEGVKGTVVRPRQVPAKVKGCRIAAPAPFTVAAGDVIELDYTYPVVLGAFPTKVSIKQTPDGAIDASPIGIRMVVTPQMVGASTIGFFLNAKQAGQEMVTLVIDDNEYEYAITVK